MPDPNQMQRFRRVSRIAAVIGTAFMLVMLVLLLTKCGG